MMIRNLMASALVLAVAAHGTQAQAANLVPWVAGNVNTTGTAFELPAPGGLPTGWTATHGSGPVTDDTRSVEGNQSAFIQGGIGGTGMIRAGNFESHGEYNFMFYDDMVGFEADDTTSKAIRVGLARPVDTAGPSRFGSLAVETSVSKTHYTFHIGFTFAATLVERSLGWRHMTIAWEPNAAGGTDVNFFVDGVHATAGVPMTHAAALTPTAEWMGTPFGSGSGAWVDTIPEPSSLLLSALGLAGVAGFRRRR